MHGKVVEEMLVPHVFAQVHLLKQLLGELGNCLPGLIPCMKDNGCRHK